MTTELPAQSGMLDGPGEWRKRLGAWGKGPGAGGQGPGSVGEGPWVVGEWPGGVGEGPGPEGLCRVFHGAVGSSLLVLCVQSIYNVCVCVRKMYKKQHVFKI